MTKTEFTLAKIVPALAVLVLSGCATAFSTNEYTVNVRTPEDPGKTFEVYDSDEEFIYQGTTPDIVRLKSQGADFGRETYIIRYGEDEEIVVAATITPIYYANILNLIGFAVDAATGSMWSLPGEIDLQEFDQGNVLINTDL